MFRYLKPSNFSLFQNHHLFEIDLSWRHIKLPNLQNLPIHKGWLELSKNRPVLPGQCNGLGHHKSLIVNSLRLKLNGWRWFENLKCLITILIGPGDASGRECDGPWIEVAWHLHLTALHSWFILFFILCTVRVSCVCYWFNSCLNISREDAAVTSASLSGLIPSTFNQFPWEPLL